VTLSCEDKILTFTAKQKTGNSDISEIELISEILDPNGVKYAVPSSYDVSFLLSIKNFK
jgi:hypothetical protein